MYVTFIYSDTKKVDNGIWIANSPEELWIQFSVA